MSLTPLEQEFLTGSVILPAFLNWERSFVSGPASPLYRLEHREFADRPGMVMSRVQFLPSCEGPPGHVHGGATAGLLDELLGICVWHSGHACVTQTLAIRYLKTIPLDATMYAVIEIKKTEPRSVEVEGTLYPNEKTPHVLAQGVFHRLTDEQLQKFSQLHTRR